MKFRFRFPAVGLVFATTACAGGSLGSVIPMPDSDRAVRLASRNGPAPNTLQVIFDWRVREPGVLRLDGRGSVRLQNPDRARFDLFSNGDGILTATLMGDEMCAREERALEFVPTPALLWASLGVFRPGEAVTLIDAQGYADGAVDDFRLRYRLSDGDELRYEFLSGRMTEVELRHDGDVAHSIDLTLEGGQQLPREARYTNWGANSRLTVTVETVERVDSHAPDIWYSVC